MSEWIEWTYTTEKPYPETLDTLVHVRFLNGDENVRAKPVEYWYSAFFNPIDDPAASNWHQDGKPADIVAYRVVSHVE